MSFLEDEVVPTRLKRLDRVGCEPVGDADEGGVVDGIWRAAGDDGEANVGEGEGEGLGVGGDCCAAGFQWL